MQVINPATEEIISEVTEDTESLVKEKYHALRIGQPGWAVLGVEARIACIERFYELLEEEKSILAETLTAETGKPLQQSFNELNGARGRIRWLIDHAAKW